MEIKVKYNGLEDRDIKAKEQEAQKLRMLTDNFTDPNWKQGDPIIGTMTFTDEPLPIPPLPEPIRDLAKEIDELKVKVEALLLPK